MEEFIFIERILTWLPRKIVSWIEGELDRGRYV